MVHGRSQGQKGAPAHEGKLYTLERKQPLQQPVAALWGLDEKVHGQRVQDREGLDVDGEAKGDGCQDDRVRVQPVERQQDKQGNEGLGVAARGDGEDHRVEGPQRDQPRDRRLVHLSYLEQFLHSTVR